MSDDHYSLSSRVFHAIREDILNGKYQANEELKEKSIGEEMGCKQYYKRTIRRIGRDGFSFRLSFFKRKLGSDGGIGQSLS